MTCCPEHLDRVWLDVHGELEGREAEDWQRHLEECPDCRAERARLARLLEAAGEALEPEPLSAEAEADLKKRILERLEPELERQREGSVRPAFRPAAWAAGALALAVLVSGWLWLDWGGEGPPLQTVATLEREAAANPEDREILRNLGLLENLEVVEKVVKVIDQREIQL